MIEKTCKNCKWSCIDVVSCKMCPIEQKCDEALMHCKRCVAVRGVAVREGFEEKMEAAKIITNADRV